MMEKSSQRSARVRWARFALLIFLPLFPISAAAQDTSTKPTVDNLHEIGTALAVCMNPLPVIDHYQGMRVTARLAFNSRGQPIGPPQFTYITQDAPNRIKTEYKNAISDALERCTPLSFSANLGAKIAGVPIILSFDERGLMRAGFAGSSAYVVAVPLPSSQVSPITPPVPLMQPPMRQEPPISLPGIANPIPNLPHGTETSQDQRARCMFQSGLYGVPTTRFSQYMGLCSTH
jgi:hypothetical protein